MRKMLITPLVAALTLVAVHSADAQEGETWNTMEPVYNVTTIKIHPNMGEQYLNNLKRTWVTGVNASMEEGIVDDYWVFASLTPNDGGYNLMIVTKHPNLASMDATDAWRAKIAKVEAKVLQQISDEESDEITSRVYPEVRTITSQKMMREIEFLEN